MNIRAKALDRVTILVNCLQVFLVTERLFLSMIILDIIIIFLNMYRTHPWKYHALFYTVIRRWVSLSNFNVIAWVVLYTYYSKNLENISFNSLYSLKYRKIVNNRLIKYRVNKIMKLFY